MTKNKQTNHFDALHNQKHPPFKNVEIQFLAYSLFKANNLFTETHKFQK